MKLYIEITHLDGLDAHGFIAVVDKSDNEVLVPISMPLQSLETALETGLLTALENYPTQSTLFLSPHEIAHITFD